MKPLKISQILHTLMLLVVSACGYTNLKQEAPQINYLKVNQKFSITLPEDHQKGETWQVVKDENYQAFEDLGAVWHGTEKGLDINLKCLSSGQYTISLIKRVYQDTLDNKQFIVNIENVTVE